MLVYDLSVPAGDGWRENNGKGGAQRMAMRYFCAYDSYLDTLAALSDQECGRLFRACLQYSRDRVEAPLSGNERFIFPALKGQIDRDRDRYEERCRKNRQNRLAAERRKQPLTIVNDCDQGEGKEKREEISNRSVRSSRCSRIYSMWQLHPKGKSEE